ncbi:TPA: recombinase family protein, partial [Clostridium perfringens]|nr:recombinase family protein [Clostridium perfringens]
PRVEYPGNFKEVYDKWKAKKITGVKAMELMNLKKNSFYNLIKKYEIEK